MALRTRWSAMVVVASAAALVAAGCSSGEKTSGSTTTTSGAASTSSSAVPTTAGGVPKCPTAQLTLKRSGGQGAAGTVGTIFEFTNTGSAACHLNGYPGLAFTYEDGKQAPTTVNRGTGMISSGWPKPTQVNIAAGGHAYFVMDYSDVPEGNAACPTYPSLIVTPPNDATVIPVQTATSPCPRNGVATVSVSAVTGSVPKQ